MPRTYTEAAVARLAEAAYASGRANFRVDRDRCALLVIDMQDEFVRPGWTPFWVPEATRMVPQCQRLLAVCRDHGLPIIFTAFAETNGYLDRPRTGAMMPNRFGEEDETWFRDGTIWHELAPQPGELVLRKPSYGAFYDTPLETMLKNLGRDTVIIAGTLTNFCCGTTARQAYERGFHVVFAADVTATDDPAMQEPELRVLRKGFALVLNLEEILVALTALPSA